MVNSLYKELIYIQRAFKKFKGWAPYFIFFICLPLLSNCQTNDISGIYLNKYSGNYSIYTTYLRLSADGVFNWFENIDEGDITPALISIGTFERFHDSLLFKAKYDSSYGTGKLKQAEFYDYSGFKFMVLKSGLQLIGPVNFGEQSNSLVKYVKIDFAKLDSVQLCAYRNDTISSIEDVLIKKDNTGKYSYSKFHVKHKTTLDSTEYFTLNNFKYSYVVTALKNMNWFSMKRNQSPNFLIIFGCVRMFFGKEHYEFYGRYLSDELYNLFFQNLLK